MRLFIFSNVHNDLGMAKRLAGQHQALIAPFDGATP
jgi:hypothetical protein